MKSCTSLQEVFLFIVGSCIFCFTVAKIIKSRCQFESKSYLIHRTIHTMLFSLLLLLPFAFSTELAKNSDCLNVAPFQVVTINSAGLLEVPQSAQSYVKIKKIFKILHLSVKIFFQITTPLFLLFCSICIYYKILVELIKFFVIPLYTEHCSGTKRTIAEGTN